MLQGSHAEIGLIDRKSLVAVLGIAHVGDTGKDICMPISVPRPDPWIGTQRLAHAACQNPYHLSNFLYLFSITEYMR